MLSIVATPIGNLKDITQRALETLREADLVLCEDTRNTKKLLDAYEIKTPTMSYHQHSGGGKVRDIINLLKEGKHLALVTDAGTPGISDPGNALVAQIIKETDQQIEISPIPGASAIAAALSVSGFPTDKFMFMGFPPHKNKRNKYFQEVADCEYTVAFYESNHRIKKTLTELAAVLDPKRELCVCRELTKQFETIYRGTISEIVEMEVMEKGEFVVIINTL
jgi:16S rRNA (cytidine1402-2'-O)-methyltransferase